MRAAFFVPQSYLKYKKDKYYLLLGKKQKLAINYKTFHCFIILLVFIGVPASAHSDSEIIQKPAIIELADEKQIFEIYEVKISTTPPLWLKEAKGQSETFTYQADNKFHFQQVPKGQTLKNWTYMSGVEAIYLKDKKPKSSDLQIAKDFENRCNNKHLSEWNDLNPDKWFIMHFCPAVPKAKINSNEPSNNGEMGFFEVAKINDTYVIVYTMWRGNEFNLNEPDKWPAGAEERAYEGSRLHREIILEKIQ